MPEMPARPAWSSRALEVILGLVAALYLAAYVGVGLARIGYPYELEWFEGTSLDLLRRILAGQSIYVAPSIDFIPHIYTPLYFYVSAELAKCTGVGFLPLRLVSFVSSIGCFALLFVLARRESGSAASGLVAAGFFAACFRFSGAWYDIARVDSLALLLLLGAVLVMRHRATLGAAFLAGALGLLAFFTKQTSAPMLGALALYGAYSARGAARLALPIVLAVGVTTGTWMFDRATDGWFRYYALAIPGQGTMPHSIRWLMRFWIRDVPHVAIALAGSAWWLGRLWERRQLGDLGFFGLLLMAAGFSAWSGRIHAGGYDNVLIPLDAWLAVTSAVAVHDLRKGGSTGSPSAAARIVGLLAVAQLAILAYDPRAQIPGALDVEAGNRAVEAIRRLPGDVLVAHHPYLAVLAGKPAHGHLDLVNTIPRGSEARERLEREIDEAIRTRRFEAIVLDRRKDRMYRRRLRPDLEEHYEYRGDLFQGDGLWPYTGLITRPQDLYMRRP